jgi:predicted nucleotidyltransferase
MKMRLTEKQRVSIIEVFIEVFNPLKAELWLFGSRVDNTKLGGDIDLLIKCYELDYQELLDLKDKYEFFLQKKIGQRKIDIVLEFSEDCQKRLIVINAKKSGILLITTPFKQEKMMLNEQNILYQRLRTYIEVINFNLETEEEIEKAIHRLNLYPITERALVDLSIDKRAFIDALIYRFLIIQDYASNKLFPLIAQIITNQSQQFSWFDILALMEKYQIITSEEQWDKLRKLRNLLSHEYENIPELRAIDINRLMDSLPLFYKQIQLMNAYVKKIVHPSD